MKSDVDKINELELSLLTGLSEQTLGRRMRDGKLRFELANGRCWFKQEVARAFAKTDGRPDRKYLRLELLPVPKDMQQVYAHGLATVIQLCSCEDSKIRLMAAERLMTEAKEQAEKRRELEARRAPERREKIDDEALVRELRALYLKAGIPPERAQTGEARWRSRWWWRRGRTRSK